MKTAAVAAMMLGSASAFHSKVNKVEGDIIKGDYIFTVSPTAQLDSCLSGVLSKGGLDKVDFIYDGDASFHGFSVHGMDEKDAAAIADLPEVEAVEEGQVMYAYGLQTNPTWGLDRVDQESATLDNLYYYKDSAGAGVDVYVIDTGVRITHNDFGSRASHGYTAFNSNNDGNGHGTHCASTAAGTTWGVAKNANVIGVKVLSDFGSGSTNGVVAGVNWANGQSSSRTKVGNMSLGGGASAAMDNAVNAGTDIVHVVASGNSNANACNFSPARASGAYTVNAMQQGDSRSSFSNFGSCTDIFAPGTSITAAWINSDSSTNTISGTSMASPHVAGIAALLVGESGSMSVSQVKAAMTSNAYSGKISNAGTGSPNLMAYNTRD
jgi:subtilisin family serine protease